MDATSSPVAPPGGPLPDDYRDAIHRLSKQAQQEDQQAEEARRLAAKRPFSRFVKIGALLIVAQLVLLTVLYLRQQTVSAQREIESILPANSCNAAVNKTYWTIVAYLRAEGHPPVSLNDLVPKYLDKLPSDPVTGKPLSYSADGSRFQVRCPEISVSGTSSASSR